MKIMLDGPSLSHVELNLPVVTGVPAASQRRDDDQDADGRLLQHRERDDHPAQAALAYERVRKIKTPFLQRSNSSILTQCRITHESPTPKIL